MYYVDGALGVPPTMPLHPPLLSLTLPRPLPHTHTGPPPCTAIVCVPPPHHPAPPCPHPSPSSLPCCAVQPLLWLRTAEALLGCHRQQQQQAQQAASSSGFEAASCRSSNVGGSSSSGLRGGAGLAAGGQLGWLLQQLQPDGGAARGPGPGAELVQVGGHRCGWGRWGRAHAESGDGYTQHNLHKPAHPAPYSHTCTMDFPPLPCPAPPPHTGGHRVPPLGPKLAGGAEAASPLPHAQHGSHVPAAAAGRAGGLWLLQRQ